MINKHSVFKPFLQLNTIVKFTTKKSLDNPLCILLLIVKKYRSVMRRQRKNMSDHS